MSETNLFLILLLLWPALWALFLAVLVAFAMWDDLLGNYFDKDR